MKIHSHTHIIQGVVKHVQFAEHPPQDYRDAVQLELLVICPGFGISHDFFPNEKFSMERYCTFCIECAFTIPSNRFKSVLRCQSSRSKDPLIWLDQFELLLQKNSEALIEAGHQMKLVKWLSLIEIERHDRQKLIAKANKPVSKNQSLVQHEAAPEENFEKIKEECLQIKSTASKLILLHRTLGDYRQKKSHANFHIPTRFEINMRIEIDTLEKIRKLELLDEFKKAQTKHNPLHSKENNTFLLLGSCSWDGVKSVKESLINKRFIARKTTSKNFKAIFRNTIPDQKIIWIGARSKLRYFVRMLWKKHKITSSDIWKSAANSFVLASNPEYDIRNLRNCKDPQLPTDREEIERIVNSL